MHVPGLYTEVDMTEGVKPDLDNARNNETMRKKYRTTPM